MMKKILSLLLTTTLLFCLITFANAKGKSVTVNVDFSGQTHKISPYIYGINDYAYFDDVTSVRQGGNRYSGYNWETNFSNAGNDWQHYSDTYLPSTIPNSYREKTACMPLWLSDIAKRKYKVTTLQMAGYVSKDSLGAVNESETAPSARFAEVKAKKNSAFSLSPDTNDNYVYMDEYVNYLVNTLGDSQSENGINGYLLDNEPALWSSTHPRIHPNKTTYNELIEKSAELSLAVKAVDKNAEIFGPALYGVGAYADLGEAPDKDESYDSFISYYLDKMKQKSSQYGTRLLDVLDIHYYSEARGMCRVTECNDTNHTDCIKARLQAVRSLKEEGYYENSWIGQWKNDSLPILTKVKASIDKYYPDTKLSLTEYSFGGGTQISGAIAEADALGTFGEMGVYLATLWDSGEYQKSAISLYTNYDKNGSSFGDTFIPSTVSDIENCSSYASIHSDTNNANLVLMNKSLTDSQNYGVTLSSAKQNYKTATIWGITNGSPEIQCLGVVDITDNKFTVSLPALSVVNIELKTSNEQVKEDIKGDVNKDGNVDVIDVVLIRSHIVGTRLLDAIDNKAIQRADMNEDKSVDIIDVVMLRKQIVK